MGKKKIFQVLGPSVRAILDILWRGGPSPIRHIRQQHTVANSTVVTTLHVLRRKGFVMRQREDRLPHFGAAASKPELLRIVFELQLAELGATAAERAHVAEALRRG